ECRPVTAEVAGSSPVRIAENLLEIEDFFIYTLSEIKTIRFLYFITANQSGSRISNLYIHDNSMEADPFKIDHINFQ
ncbi:hypothetical protein, partial [Chryseobacterium arthrosphaerae]|uniref:hypothetical protein n=1 Tax=Chryseobacterium arthrosphaerae TaxID=651561 RepID=UPI001F4AB1BC